MKKFLKILIEFVVAVTMVMIAAFGIVFVDYECSRIYGNECVLADLFLEEKNTICYHICN